MYGTTKANMNHVVLFGRSTSGHYIHMKPVGTTHSSYSYTASTTETALAWFSHADVTENAAGGRVMIIRSNGMPGSQFITVLVSKFNQTQGVTVPRLSMNATQDTTAEGGMLFLAQSHFVYRKV